MEIASGWQKLLVGLFQVLAYHKPLANQETKPAWKIASS